MYQNGVNPSFGSRYDSFDACSEKTAGIGCKPVWQMNLTGGLYLWMQKALKTPESKQNPRNPRNPRLKTMIFLLKIVLKSAKSASKNCVHLCNLWLFLCKTKPIPYPQNQRIPLCTKILYQIYNFVESQNKPNSNPIFTRQSQTNPFFYPP